MALTPTTLLALAVMSTVPPPTRFDVVWNSPWPAGCHLGTVDPVPDFERYGVSSDTRLAPPSSDAYISHGGIAMCTFDRGSASWGW
jgi:hypothetical protein